MKKPKERFNVVAKMEPGEGVSQRHRVSPSWKTLEEADAKFGPMIREAAFDKDVLELRLCRYTVGRTEVINCWTRAQLDMLAKDIAA